MPIATIGFIVALGAALIAKHAPRRMNLSQTITVLLVTMGTICRAIHVRVTPVRQRIQDPRVKDVEISICERMIISAMIATMDTTSKAPLA